MTRVIQILFFILPVFGFSQTDTIVHLYAFGGNNNDGSPRIIKRKLIAVGSKSEDLS